MSYPPTESQLDREVEILRSYDTARRTLQNLPPIDTHDDQELGFGAILSLISSAFAKSPTSSEPEVERLIDLAEHITIERRKHSSIVSIIVSNASAERAAQLANGLADSYLAVRQETRVETAQAAETALAMRVNDLSANLRSIEGRIDDMLLAAAAANLALQDGVTASQNSAVTNVLEGLARQRRALFAERAEITQMLRAEHRTATNNRAGLFDLRARRDQIDQELTALETTTAGARQQLQSFLNTDDLAPSLALSLLRLQEEAQTTRDMYRDALERWQQVQLQASQYEPEASILSHAIPPLQSDHPMKLYVASAGLALGFCLGAGIGFVRERVLLGVYEAATIEKATQLPIIALLPAVSRFDASAPQDLIVTHPLSRFTEGVRHIASALDHDSQKSEQITQNALCVLMVSPNANEGKSTLALSYAMHHAILGKSALLIDADMHQAALFDRLRWQMETDATQFSDVLAGHGTLADIDDLTFCDPQTGLHVLGNTKPSLDRPDTLLASARFSELISSAKAKYDIIVIDSAPILDRIDARILLSYADIALMAVRYGKTTLPNIQQALLQLDQHRGPSIFGALTFVEQHDGKR